MSLHGGNLAATKKAGTIPLEQIPSKFPVKELSFNIGILSACCTEYHCVRSSMYALHAFVYSYTNPITKTANISNDLSSSKSAGKYSWIGYDWGVSKRWSTSVVCSIVKAMFPSSVTPLLACCANPEDQILEWTKFSWNAIDSSHFMKQKSHEQTYFGDCQSMMRLDPESANL